MEGIDLQTELTAEEFKACVPMYFELDDEISRLSKRTSELRKKKDAIGQMLIKFMRTKNIDECELHDGSGKLVRRESKRTEPLKKEHVLEELLRLHNRDATKAQSSLESIFGMRKIETKDMLSRAKV